MMEWSLKLDASETSNQQLIAWMRGHQLIQYVVVYGYDGTKEFGSQWDSGHYFNMDLEDAIRYLHRYDNEEMENAA